MSYDNLSILVSSCDKYAACWGAFCHGLQKYWPAHPQNVFFITNQLESPCGISLKTREDRGWAPNLLQALALIPTDYILYAQEDYWIKHAVPDANIQAYLGYLQTGLVDYIRLYPAPGPDSAWSQDERLGVIGTGSHYRASLQLALWRKQTLLELLDPAESPWDFEVKGTHRSRAYGERFLCVSKRQDGIDYVFTAIVNGYWSQAARDYVTQEAIDVDYAALPMKSRLQVLKDGLHSCAYKLKKRSIKVLSKGTGKTGK